MRAARTHVGNGVADDTLYWYQAPTSAEAAYLTVLLNTNCLQHAFTSSKESGRDFHLHPWRKVPIPGTTTPSGYTGRSLRSARRREGRRRSAQSSQSNHQPRMSKAVRNALASDGIATAMDDCTRQLLPDQATERAP